MQFGDVTLKRQGLEEWLFSQAMKIAITNVGRGLRHMLWYGERAADRAQSKPLPK
jgi:hypothetical protein